MKNRDVYDALVAKLPHIERKGKTMPYTSSNGYMFSLLNKAGEIGIRLPKASAAAFMEKYEGSGPFLSHGAVMRDYVLVPENLFEQLDLLAGYLDESYHYVMTLPPK
jgi:hypothetical protein